MKNIHAFTEGGSNYPGYISINDEGGTLSISTRSRGGAGGCVLHTDRDQLQCMADDINTYLQATAPKAEKLAPPPNLSKPPKAVRVHDSMIDPDRDPVQS